MIHRFVTALLCLGLLLAVAPAAHAEATAMAVAMNCNGVTIQWNRPPTVPGSMVITLIPVHPSGPDRVVNVTLNSPKTFEHRWGFSLKGTYKTKVRCTTAGGKTFEKTSNPVTCR